MSELRDRLRTARKSIGLTQAKVASSIEGLSQPAYSDLESGRSKSTSKIAELARLLNVSAIWLATGQYEGQSPSGINAALATMPNAVGTVVRKVPIRGRAKMSDSGFWEEIDYPVGYDGGFVYAQGASEDAYAIEGSDMSLYPAIRAGWILVFEPNHPAVPGEFVHVGLKDGQKMIKEFISQRNGVVNLLSINGGARLAFDMSEVEFISAFRSMYPPSAVAHQASQTEPC